MKPITAWLWAMTILCSGAMNLVRAELKATTLAKPLPVKVTLSGTFENIDGTLIRYDATSLVIRTGKGERDLKWFGLTRLTHFALRKQLVDPKSAAEWMDLAQLASKLDMQQEAESALANAARIDPTLRPKGDATGGGGTSAERRATTAPSNPTAFRPTVNPAAQLIGPKNAKYEQATAAQHLAAIEYA
jgi:hypothetical protein